jgi:hypothetical protein
VRGGVPVLEHPLNGGVVLRGEGCAWAVGVGSGKERGVATTGALYRRCCGEWATDTLYRRRGRCAIGAETGEGGG